MSDLSYPLLIFIAIVVLYVLNSIKILREYERGVIFTPGPRLAHALRAGHHLGLPALQQMVRISLRQDVLEVPPQDVITRDNVTIKVNAVVTLYVVSPNDAAIKVANYVYQTSQLAQTTLRSVLGEVELDELLSHRDKLNLQNSNHHGSAHGAVRREGDLGRSEAGGPARADAARHGQAGRGRARKTVEDHPCLGRVQRRAKAGGRRRPAGHRADDAAIALPANADRDRRGEEHNHCLPAADGDDDALQQDRGNGQGGS